MQNDITLGKVCDGDSKTGTLLLLRDRHRYQGKLLALGFNMRSRYTNGVKTQFGAQFNKCSDKFLMSTVIGPVFTEVFCALFAWSKRIPVK